MAGLGDFMRPRTDREWPRCYLILVSIDHPFQCSSWTSASCCRVSWSSWRNSRTSRQTEATIVPLARKASRRHPTRKRSSDRPSEKTSEQSKIIPNSDAGTAFTIHSPIESSGAGGSKGGRTSFSLATVLVLNPLCVVMESIRNQGEFGQDSQDQQGFMM